MTAVQVPGAPDEGARGTVTNASRAAARAAAAWFNRPAGPLASDERPDEQRDRERMSAGPSRTDGAAAGRAGAVAGLCTELELSAPTLEPVGDEVTTVRVLVRLHRTPLGFVSVAPEEYARPGAVLALALDQLRADVVAHLEVDGLAPTVDDGPVDDETLGRALSAPCPRPLLDEHVSVVVATRNRPEHVWGCLEQLLALEHPSFDVTVVDNDPATDATRDVVAALVGDDPRFTYVRLDRAGVSRARNAGIDRARGPLVAFIDDDVRVDPFWLQGLVRAFASSPAVTCVTGLIAARTISGAEQLYFDSRVSWSASLEPHVYHPTSDDPLHPWAAGRFGAGANMAFRLDAVRALGGFDLDLGPGTPAKGAEDIDLFVRALRAGGDLRYDPAALAWHIHRSDAAALEQQLFGYGAGLTAYLFKHALSPRVALDMLGRLPRAVRHIATVTKVEGVDAGPAEDASRYRRIELSGMALGPLLYLRSRLRRGSEHGTPLRRSGP